MGSALTERLIDQGWRVVAWNRSRRALDEAVADGAVAAASPADCLATGLVLSVLSHEAAVDAVFNPELLAAAPDGTVHVNLSTISAAAGDRLAAMHADAGVGYVGSPVLGRNNVARAGSLVALVAGPPDAVEQARPALEDISRRIWSLGERAGDANTVKIAVNFMILHALQAMSESIALVEERNLDGLQLIDIITDSMFPGPVYTGYGKAMAARRYQPVGFSTTLGRKDLGLALSAAAATGLTLPSGGVLQEIFDAAIAQDLGDLDWSAITEITRPGR
jgi:3-hydroxyisobutyrate dehydrogenase-like beta-hydroxyacid dehydrogenase